MASQLSQVSPKDSSSDVDGGWAWVILTTSFLSFAILWGQVYSFNIYFVIFLQVFGESRSYTAWIGSLNLAVIQLAAISAGFFILKLGGRGTTLLGSFVATLGYVVCYLSTSVLHLLISYGIVVAFGYSICVYGCLEAISQHFRRHLYTAAGISISGGGVGIMCMNYLIQWLIDTYGWRGSMLIQGAIALQIAVLASTFYPLTSKMAKEHDAVLGSDVMEGLMTWKQRVTDLRMVLLVISCTLQGISIFTLYIVYKDLAISAGLQSSFVATMIAVGIGNIFGRGASGIIMNYLPPILYYATVVCLGAIVMFVNIFNPVPEIFVLMGGLLGYSHGSISTVLPLVIAFMFGRREMATTFSYLMFWGGFGTLIGPPLAGFLTDRTQSYFSCLVMSGSFLVVCMVLTLILHHCHRRNIQNVTVARISCDGPEVKQPFANSSNLAVE